jgi:hypothetical protein
MVMYGSIGRITDEVYYIMQMTVPPVARQDVIRWRWCTMGNVILQKEGFAKQMIALGHCVAGVTEQLPLNHEGYNPRWREHGTGYPICSWKPEKLERSVHMDETDMSMEVNPNSQGGTNLMLSPTESDKVCST